jgi:hypothetical protein
VVPKTDTANIHLPKVVVHKTEEVERDESPTYKPPREHPQVFHDDHHKGNNGLELPFYPEPVPHKKIEYTNKDIEDIIHKAPPRLDSERDEPPEERKANKERIKEKEDKE